MQLKILLKSFNLLTFILRENSLYIFHFLARICSQKYILMFSLGNDKDKNYFPFTPTKD